MYALTLQQPWASLVALGAKRIETRSWATRYRGPLAIHAAARLPPAARALCAREPFRTALGGRGPEELSRGCVLAVVRLVDCRPVEACDLPPPPERCFGDYSPGRWLWLLADSQPLPQPLPARGALGLWRWQPDRPGP